MARDVPRELVARGVRLRPPTLADGQAVYTAVRASLAEFMRWLPWASERYSLRDANDWIAASAVNWPNGPRCPFLVFDARSSELVACCGLERSTDPGQAHVASLGYWVRTDRTGRGYAGLAARAVARFGIHELGLARIEVLVAEQNLPSIRTAERIGAQREGTLRRRIAVGGQLHDAAVFSLVRADFDR